MHSRLRAAIRPPFWRSFDYGHFWAGLVSLMRTFFRPAPPPKKSSLQSQSAMHCRLRTLEGPGPTRKATLGRAEGRGNRHYECMPTRRACPKRVRKPRGMSGTLGQCARDVIVTEIASRREMGMKDFDPESRRFGRSRLLAVAPSENCGSGWCRRNACSGGCRWVGRRWRGIWPRPEYWARFDLP